MGEYALPLAALGIALVTFVATQIKGLQTADRDHVRALSDEVNVFRTELVDCRKMKGQLDSEIMQLRGENLRLYQRVNELERKVNGG